MTIVTIPCVVELALKKRQSFSKNLKISKSLLQQVALFTGAHQISLCLREYECASVAC